MQSNGVVICAARQFLMVAAMTETSAISQTDRTLSTVFSDALNAAGQSLEKISHDYYVIAKMQGNDDGSMGGIRVNQSGRIETAAQPDKEKEYSRHMQLLLLLHDIEQMEAQLEDKYGENFAEQLAAEHLDEETYQRIMAIEDEEERRRQIALTLKEGIKNGTIDPAVFDDPQIREWIDARSEQRQMAASANFSNATIDLEINEDNFDSDKSDSLSKGLSNFLP